MQNAWPPKKIIVLPNTTMSIAFVENTKVETRLPSGCDRVLHPTQLVCQQHQMQNWSKMSTSASYQDPLLSLIRRDKTYQHMFWVVFLFLLFYSCPAIINLLLNNSFSRDELVQHKRRSNQGAVQEIVLDGDMQCQMVELKGLIRKCQNQSFLSTTLKGANKKI